MYFFFSLIPATLVGALGYVVLYLSLRTEGTVRTLGQALAIWIFVLAALFPSAGAYVSYAGLSPVGTAMQSMHPRGTL